MICLTTYMFPFTNKTFISLKWCRYLSHLMYMCDLCPQPTEVTCLAFITAEKHCFTVR